MTGSLIFGIGTQSNNGLGSAKIFTLDDTANFATTFNGQTYSIELHRLGLERHLLPGFGGDRSARLQEQHGILLPADA